MFLVFMPVFCVLFDSSSGVKHKSVCYGKSVSLPVQISRHYTGPLYFTPSNGGPRKLMMDEGKAFDPRIDINNTIYLSDLNERDGGTFAAILGSRLKDVLTLDILDCAKEIRKFYGNALEYDVPEHAEFLEFTPIHSLDQPVILWNRTDPQTSDGGQVRENVLTIYHLTQADNGYYNFRRKDFTLELRLHLTVEGHFDHYHGEKKFLFIRYPRTGGPWTLTFKPQDKEPEIVMEAGNLVSEDNWFFGRIYPKENGIEIDILDSSDSGTFDFRDPQGNLALSYLLDIIPEPNHQPKYIAVSVGIVCLVILGCCCCLKRCCKINKFAAQTATAPAVYYHGVNLSSDQRHSNTQHLSAFPHQAVNSAPSERPISTSFEPLEYQPVNTNMSQPKVTPPAHLGSVPAPSSSSDFPSSDAEPRFKLKGLGFPSATPLTSDTPFSDVYTSDKLNFL
ncbi:uncharacterized protein LOC121643164 [Melanotaenia boesemani]|uniref:uncharacterized protein LOC121643164 n=1 Tax=Melanotaenia boesemani TaxID=1250792 RepID=UPI001C044917|nr:uncharacterized protein LOC121643164 [Melanotaenia boesemani]